ncbi:phosphatase PAP2 family protein [Foetidibacter luteolus]|uniref:phosphatase PAP2 family protein n=1 Tax=Foetidibacter luteolus TaxID=2608880 RepID=UPI00129C09AA|nr:phosphatase PAP2 family protein [Foetidibacter luteolus]
MQPLNYKNFKAGAIITLLFAAVLFTGVYVKGNIDLFLTLNSNLGVLADWFFRLVTNGGDGIMWAVMLFVLLYILKRKDALPLLISCFVFTTLFTQVCKYIIVPDEPRPIKAIPDTSLIHTVPGVELHTISSFPSGHTAAAFSFYLLLCLLLPKKSWLAVGAFCALLVAYSRIYLAQHFPVDLAAGMITALVSVLLSILIQKGFEKRRVPR